MGLLACIQSLCSRVSHKHPFLHKVSRAGLTFLAVLRLPLCSGLKLYGMGCIFNGLQAWYTGGLQEPLLQGFSSWTWVVVVTQAANGLLYAAVMKVSDAIQYPNCLAFAQLPLPLYRQYASNLARLCIVAVAMILASVLADWQLGFRPSLSLIASGILVTAGLALYFRPPKR